MGISVTDRSREQIEADLERAGSRSKLALEYGMAKSTLYDLMRSFDPPIESPHGRARTRPSRPSTVVRKPAATGELKPGTKVSGDKVEVVLPKTTTAPPPEGLRDPDTILRNANLDPERFRLKVYTDNHWDGPSQGGPITYYQSKVVAEVRPVAADFPVTFDPTWFPPAPRRRKIVPGPMLVPQFFDPHFPLHEEDLYEATLVWLDEYKDRIKEILIPGDEGDWTPFSRWGKNKRINVGVREAQLGVYEGLSGWRAAAPDVPMEILPGNHTHWLIKRMGEVYPDALELQRPGEDFKLLSLRSVVNLDSLHIDYNDTEGEYHDVFREIAPGLISMHGVATGEFGGATKEIKVWEGASVFQGHDHSGQLTVINKRLTDGGYTQHYAVSGMAMCRKDLGYSHKHNVAQGFPVTAVWPDGRFHIDLAFFNPQTRETTWRDFRYRP